MKRLELTTTIDDINVRASGDGSDTFTVRGHAAVFGRLSENLGGFRERIAPGAFSKILDQSPDVRLLFNHEGLPLARSTAGTLELREDPHGLHVWARLDARRTDAADLRYALERGDVSQMSFAFRVSQENDVRDGEDEHGVPIYEVREVSDLLDASIVSYAAYPQTDVSLVRMRCVDEREPGLLFPAKLNDRTIAAAAALVGMTPSELRDVTAEEFDRLVRDAVPGLDGTTATDTSAGAALPDREFLARRRKAVIAVRARLMESGR